MELGTNYPLIILSVIVGAIIGGLIVFFLDLFLRGLEKEGQLAIKNKYEVYEPLYDQVEKIWENINLYQIPSQVDMRQENPLTFWEKLPPSVKRRAPGDIAQLIEDFYKKAKEYFYLYLEAGKILRFSIRDVLNKRKQDLEMDDQELKLVEAKLYDSYSSDFYSGKILNIKHSYELEDLLKIKKPENINDYKMIPMSIFNEICSYIERDRFPFPSGASQHHYVKEFRECRDQLLKIIEEIKKLLELKIDYITNNYENRYSIIRIISSSLLGKRIEV
ncbi:MAG: hypothetical protein KIH08_04220 [Candidatus Freyarchaeota archaeon]|nr:hypothetical protein [Candidatus Jordarchaeia archaeon]MBS7267892.1 hypothetical protein [Candidatus Jordarchaeia archaeon]MBS7279054.1 hypothetical protein [Candidatus Jordarchaeia archaeon]